MTDNPNFAKPSPPVKDVDAIVAAYLLALSQCTDGDRQKIAIKNQKREALINVLHTWGLYVMLHSNNDVAVALSSGFQVAKTPSPIPPLEKPAAPVLEAGINPGEMISRGKRNAAILVYLHQYATEAEMAQGQWKSQPCSKSTCILTDLVPGTRYYCRLLVVGRKEQLLYSDVVSRIAA